MYRPSTMVAIVVLLVVLLAGCTSSATSPSASSLPRGFAVDYQLGANTNLRRRSESSCGDSTDSPASGIFSVCYVNAFQTQPGDAADWLRERSDLVLYGSSGEPLIDANWPDEMILDTSTSGKRESLSEFVGETIALCAQKGFDAVEFDNLDSWTRWGGALNERNSLDFARLIVTIAHSAGLLAAQKNSAELGERGRDQAGFDFAVAEECARFDECDAYTDVYGDAVVDIEYADDLPRPFADLCRDTATPAMTVLRDRNLVTRASDGYVFETC